MVGAFWLNSGVSRVMSKWIFISGICLSLMVAQANANICAEPLTEDQIEEIRNAYRDKGITAEYLREQFMKGIVEPEVTMEDKFTNGLLRKMDSNIDWELMASEPERLVEMGCKMQGLKLGG